MNLQPATCNWFTTPEIEVEHPPLGLHVAPLGRVDYFVMTLCITGLSALALW